MDSGTPLGSPRRAAHEGRRLEPGRPIAILEPDGTLALTLWGSSSNPWVPVNLTVLGDNHIRVDVDVKHHGPSTADFAATTKDTRLPAEIDLRRPVTVDIAFSRGTSTTTVAEPLTSEE